MSSKILVVDDEKGIVATLEDYFETQGYQVYCAYSGKEALEKISYKPDIILLDINMPEMNGLAIKDCVSINIACDNEKVTLRVCDDGTGFSPTILEKGATPFLRDDNMEQGQNFGIGLYLCHLLCQKHGGCLVLENDSSGAKVTATFYFCIVEK